jgi:hypothetical protein
MWVAADVDTLLAERPGLAVFESGSRWFLGNTWAVPLGEAVLRCIRRR